MAEHADAPGTELTVTEEDSTTPGLDCQSQKEEQSSGPPSATVPEERDADPATDADDETTAETGDVHEATELRGVKPRVRLALAVGSVALIGVSALAGWFGYRAYETHQANDKRSMFLQVARQGALNLTTIDWEHADTDVQRIQDSATGAFFDDFSKRAKDFIGVVKQAQAKSAGTITEAGMESESSDEGKVLVAVSVKTTNRGAAEQDPRFWRMRITVHMTNDGTKVSNVVFVP